MVMVDPFKGDGYSITTLSAAINKLPNRYGRLQQLGLMPIKGVTTRNINMEEKNGVLTLVPTTAWGAPAFQNETGKRKLRTFTIPHMPIEDSVLAGDVQGIRAFGSENATEAVSTKVAEKLQSMRDKLDQTLEYRRMGALKGILTDADGSSVLYNLYTEFGITQKVVDFVLGTAGTDVRAKCMEVLRHIEDNLMGEVSNGVRCLVSEEFYDKLTSHAKVVAAFQNWQAAQERLAGDMRTGFVFGGITFEEYRGKTSNASGSVIRYIAAGDGHAYPTGTADTFATYAAPADFVETVNTIGQQYYAKQEAMKYGRGIDILAQSNVLPMVSRPGVLVRVHSSN